jgi:hypothetical protein
MDPRDERPRRGSFAALSIAVTRAADAGRQLGGMVRWPRWWFWPLVFAAGVGLIFFVGWL